MPHEEIKPIDHLSNFYPTILRKVFHSGSNS